MLILSTATDCHIHCLCECVSVRAFIFSIFEWLVDKEELCKSQSEEAVALEFDRDYVSIVISAAQAQNIHIRKICIVHVCV